MPLVGAGGRAEELRNRQRARQEEQFRLTQVPHFGASGSGFTGERDYLNALNEDAELENLDSLNAGHGLAKSNGGYQLPGLRQARPGVGSMSLTAGGSTDMVEQQRSANSEDPYDKRVRMAGADLADQAVTQGRMGIEEQTRGQYDRAAAASAPRGTRALDLGYSGAAAKKVGDIERSEGLENARAGANAFMDPTVTHARQTQNSEDERLLESRYGRQAEADAKVQAAQIAANGRIGAAGVTAQGGVSRDAIKGLLKSRELQGMIGGQTLGPAQMQDLEDLMLRNLNGQGGQPQPQQQVDPASFEALVAGAGDNGPGADKLAQWWDQLTPQQQQIARQRLGGR